MTVSKITVLDGWTLNPGDLSWNELEQLGEVTVFDRTEPEQIIERAREAEVLLTNKVPFNAEMIAALPKLRLISVLATGYNIIDVKAARTRGVSVANVPGYSTESVVQSAFAHLLNLASSLAFYTGQVRAGTWTSAPDFTFYGAPLTELAGKKFGIVGFGTIGKRAAEVAAAFGMEPIAYSRSLVPGTIVHNVRAVTLNELFQTADVVSLHAPLNEESYHLVNRERLSSMKPTAFLINTARGPLVDSQALADALNSGTIAGAGIDVLTEEPPAETEPLLTARNCFITPHNAWASLDARKRLMAVTAANVRGFLAGTPQNIVN